MKKMLIVMLAIFVLSLSSIVSANGIQGNWSNALQQMNADDGQPPQEDHHKKHKPQPKPPEPHQPQPEQPQPDQPGPR